MPITIEQSIAKAAVLVEALPYMREFAGRTVVVKYGGAAMISEELRAACVQDIALLRFIGIHVIIVHGGGPEVSAAMKKSGLVPRFVDGLRVTDEETMAITQMVLVGQTNRAIVRHLLSQGARAVGLSGQDAGLIVARPHTHISRQTGENVELGFVGDVAEVHPEVLHTLIDAGFVPVVAPVGADETGQAYNINADTVAAAIAGAMRAHKLVLLTDVDGIRLVPDDPNTVQTGLSRTRLREMLDGGSLEGGMVPKAEAVLAALDAGVRQAHIVDGRVPHALLLEVFTDHGMGTLVLPDKE